MGDLVFAFIIIQAPPGDFVDTYIANLSASGSVVSMEEAKGLRILYGLDQPIYVQYFKWMSRILVVDFGESMEWRRPVIEVIGDRLWLTVVLSFAALVLTWVIALPIGIYSAVRQYSFLDYLFTAIGFVGLAVPNFLLALDHHVLLVRAVRRERRRPVLAGIRSRAVESLRRSGTWSSTCRCRR